MNNLSTFQSSFLSAHLASSLPSWFCTITLHLVSLAFILICLGSIKMESNGCNSTMLGWRSSPESHLASYIRRILMFSSSVLVRSFFSTLNNTKPSRPLLMWHLSPRNLAIFPGEASHSQTFSLAICYSVMVAAFLTIDIKVGRHLVEDLVRWLMVECFFFSFFFYNLFP